ncbi:DUF4381 family protein [Aeromonas veronii]|uniref:DUF4381 family protein n=1 Tax=Aeromonas veronii TaxID=654 RepID=UPI003CE4E7D1
MTDEPQAARHLYAARIAGRDRTTHHQLATANRRLAAAGAEPGGLALLWLYHRAQRWWQQRYRREAQAALRTINWSDAGASLALFHLIKQVLTHLDPRHGKLFGMALLQTLDNAMADRQPRFATELGERWLVSLVCNQVVLSVSDQLCLVSLCNDWLAHHQTPIQTASLATETHHA